MVKGLDTFHKYFAEYQEQYVLIGGVACDISFQYNNVDFRATRDLDIVLIVEALTKEFANTFWKFIGEGGYEHRARSNGKPQFYRFDKPVNAEFPAMIELFSRADLSFETDEVLIPIHIDDEVSSLSAILLNQEYYQTLLMGREVINGISVLKPTYIIPFKAKAWLDMSSKREQGMRVDSRDIKKHKNDIVRLVAEMVLEQKCGFPNQIKKDMQLFIDALENEPVDLKSLGIQGITSGDIVKALRDTYV